VCACVSATTTMLIKSHRGLQAAASRVSILNRRTSCKQNDLTQSAWP
jgi:hypothetical protein